MIITLKDCTLRDALEELKYQQSRGRDAYFSGQGNGEIVITVNEKYIEFQDLRTAQEVIDNC